MSEITERAARKLAEHYMVDPDTCWRSYEPAVRVVIEELLESTEAIESVARAIHFRGEDGGDDAWNHCQRYLRDMAREQARAATAVWKAMLDPALASPPVEPKEI